MFGWRKTDIIGKPYPLAANATDDLDEHLSGVDVDGVETTRHDRDDREIPVQIWSSPITQGRDGTVIALVDVTDRRRRDRELRLFKRTIEQVDESVFITDRDGVIEYVNATFTETTGYDPQDALGQNPRILKSGKHDDAFYAHLWETILADDPWRAEIVNMRKNGELYRTAQRISPITNDTGDITHFVALETDISTQHRRSQQLDVLNRLLRHNLRTAVNIIEGNAGVLVASLTDARLAKHAKTINDTTTDLLELGNKADRIRDAIERERDTQVPVSLSSLLGDLIDEFEAEYPTHKFDLVGDAGDVRVDAALAIAVDEAIQNAIDHHENPPADVTVTVGRRTDVGHIEVVIEDDGPGIPENERLVIERGEESALEHGSSLGLWLIKWVVESLGGDFHITVATPRGTRLVITLPQGANEPRAVESIGSPDVR